MEFSGSIERVRIEQLIDFKKVNFQIKDIYSSLPYRFELRKKNRFYKRRFLL